MRLQGKFEVDHSHEWTEGLITPVYLPHNSRYRRLKCPAGVVTFSRTWNILTASGFLVSARHSVLLSTHPWYGIIHSVIYCSSSESSTYWRIARLSDWFIKSGDTHSLVGWLGMSVQFVHNTHCSPPSPYPLYSFLMAVSHEFLSVLSCANLAGSFRPFTRTQSTEPGFIRVFLLVRWNFSHCSWR